MPKCSPSSFPQNVIQLKAIDYDNWNHTLILITFHICICHLVRTMDESQWTISALEEKMGKAEWKTSLVCCSGQCCDDSDSVIPLRPKPPNYIDLLFMQREGLLIWQPRPSSHYPQVPEEEHKATPCTKETPSGLNWVDSPIYILTLPSVALAPSWYS